MFRRPNLITGLIASAILSGLYYDWNFFDNNKTLTQAPFVYMLTHAHSRTRPHIHSQTLLYLVVIFNRRVLYLVVISNRRVLYSLKFVPSKQDFAICRLLWARWIRTEQCHASIMFMTCSRTHLMLLARIISKNLVYNWHKRSPYWTLWLGSETLNIVLAAGIASRSHKQYSICGSLPSLKIQLCIVLLIRFCQSRQSWVTHASCYRCIFMPRRHTRVVLTVGGMVAVDMSQMLWVYSYNLINDISPSDIHLRS